MRQSGIIKRSVRIAGHATSISLKSAFWHGLCDIAAARGLPVSVLVAKIDAERDGNLSSAIRLLCSNSRATASGQRRADLGGARC